MPFIVKEDFVNLTKGHRFGDSGWQETDADTRGEIYRRCQREYGRCVSKVYVDSPTGPPITVGWVFVSRQEYDDWRPSSRGEKTYLREVWITIREIPEPTEDES